MINTIKFILLTIIYITMLGVGYQFGFLDGLITTDTLHISKGIFVVFLYYSTLCFFNVVRLDLEALKLLNNQSSLLTRFINSIINSPSKSTHISNLELFLESKIASIRRGSTSLVLLGLIGTIVGFIIALSGIDPESISDSSNIVSVVYTLLHGIYLAFYTTLVGTTLHFCLNLYNRLLESSSVNIINRVISFYVK